MLPLRGIGLSFSFLIICCFFLVKEHHPLLIIVSTWNLLRAVLHGIAPIFVVWNVQIVLAHFCGELLLCCGASGRAPAPPLVVESRVRLSAHVDAGPIAPTDPGDWRLEICPNQRLWLWMCGGLVEWWWDKNCEWRNNDRPLVIIGDSACGDIITVSYRLPTWKSILRVPAPRGSTPEWAGGGGGEEADQPHLWGAQTCCLESTSIRGNVIEVQ